MADVPRREVLARVLVLGFVELADEFLEDRTHGGVVDLTRVEIDILKALHYLEEESPFVELADGVVKVELLEHLAHVGAEASDIVAEVSGQVRGVRQQLLEVVIGDVASFMAFHDSRSCCQRSASRLPHRAARYTDSGRTPNGFASYLPFRPNHSTH